VRAEHVLQCMVNAHDNNGEHEKRATYITVWTWFSLAVTGTYLAPFISTRCYSRGKAGDALAETWPINLAPTKTEPSESSYRIFTSKRTGKHSGFTILVTHSLHESNRRPNGNPGNERSDKTATWLLDHYPCGTSSIQFDY